MISHHSYRPSLRARSGHARRAEHWGISGCLFAFLFAPAAAVAAPGELIVNEALANEPGSATSAEWFELLNWPDTGNGIVSLLGYRYIDGKDTTRFDTALAIGPGGFVIIARKPVGTSSFESIWGNNSGVWGDAPDESYPVVSAAKMSLRNTADTVTLISPAGAMSRLIWQSDAGDGISVERRRPTRGDDPGNFGSCIDPGGSTPGRANSLLPARGDLALDSLWVFSPDPAWGEPFTVAVALANVGFGTVTDAVVDLYQDRDPASPGTELSLVQSWPVSAIAEEDTQRLAYEWGDAPPGRISLVARIRSDAIADNNERTISVAVRHTQPLVIISEYLAAPAVGGPDEWVEIVNLADFPINMSGVQIGDSLHAEPLPSAAGMMPPGLFWVLAESAVRFRAFYPEFAGVLYEIPGWRALNNTGDRIRLLGAAGEIIDSVSFRITYDSNRSTERVELKPAFAAAKDWASSVDLSGATPGRANSVVRGEPGRLAIDSLRIMNMEPAWGEPLDINVTISNVGFGPVTDGALLLLHDLHLQAPGTELAEVQRSVIAPMLEGETRTLGLAWDGAPPGILRLVARVLVGEDSTVDEEAITTVVRHTRPLVVISEYLATPDAGGPGEWVEITNAAEIPITMSGVRVGDSDGVAVLPPDAGMMGPGVYWVLVENATAFGSFYHGFAGVLWEIPGWRELSDRGDRIRLLGAAGEVIDSVSYRIAYGLNRSTERREISISVAGPRDWGGSVDPTGATPGRANSIRRLSDDLAIDSLRIVTPDPAWGEGVVIGGVVTNAGFESVSGAAIALYYSCDTGQAAALVPIARPLQMKPLEPGLSVPFEHAWPSAPPGCGRVWAALSADDDSMNNKASVDLSVRHTQPLIVVSEYLANPTSGGPGEWVEISNQAEFAINLAGARLGDSSGAAVLPAISECMPPGAFWILAENASSFRAFYPAFSEVFLEVAGWRELNNGGDRIRLLGAAGEIIDSLSYRDVSGDNRSRERTELSAAFAAAGDWAASVDPAGATPGRANSVDRRRAGSFQVAVSPNPIYRSTGEAAQISYRLEVGEQLTLAVFDRAGRRVKTIVDAQPAATGSLTWDGTDDGGRALRPGPYVLLARSDPAGAVRKIVVVVGP
jgi:hypothetical protein